jgi:hypothetical protein
MLWIWMSILEILDFTDFSVVIYLSYLTTTDMIFLEGICLPSITKEVFNTYYLYRCFRESD